VTFILKILRHNLCSNIDKDDFGTHALCFKNNGVCLYNKIKIRAK
jgi:hypothetical protein